MVDLVKVSWPGRKDCKIATLTKAALKDVHVITLKKGRVVDDNTRPKPKTNSLLGHRWFSDNNRKSMAGGERGESRARSRLSSSKSMSSLGQKSGSEASQNSQDFLAL